MVVSVCQHESFKKYGTDRKGTQRYRCLVCQKTFAEKQSRPIGDMRISMKDATLAINLLLEGMSIRAASRITGLKANTICDLVLVVGENCQQFLDRAVKGVPASDIQCDEVWSFVGMKERQRQRGNFTGDEGHSWTFIAIDRTSKLVLTHQVGQRDNATCDIFLRKLSNAVTGRPQVSTDGLASYTLGVPFAFGGKVDFGQLIKHFQNTSTVGRYSPAKITRAEKKVAFGSPDHDQICTSHIERLNLTLRMSCRRFTRLTNAHSKSLRHHCAMQALFFAWYNFARKHETLGKSTPAMAAGITSEIWSITRLLKESGEC